MPERYFGSISAPQRGRERAARRPALVLTSREYNAVSSIFIVCPITRTERPWRFNVVLPPVGRVSGFVLVDQIRAIDPAVRAFKSAGQASADTLAEVRGKLATLFGIPVSS
jgi:mRNA interferase MazF